MHRYNGCHYLTESVVYQFYCMVLYQPQTGCYVIKNHIIYESCYLFVWFHSTIFQSCRDESSWFEPVLSSG